LREKGLALASKRLANFLQSHWVLTKLGLGGSYD
jgi:hypothetical protein